MNTKNYIFSIGLNDKNTKKQEITTLDAYKIATNLIIKYFGGGTINEGKGVYTHENGDVVIETTLICTICTNEPIENFINDCKNVFNQESIMIQEVVSKIDFK